MARQNDTRNKRKPAIELSASALSQGRNRADYKPMTPTQRKVVNTAIALVPAGRAAKVGGKIAVKAGAKLSNARENRIDRLYDQGKASEKTMARQSRRLDNRANREHARETGNTKLRMAARDVRDRVQQSRDLRAERKEFGRDYFDEGDSWGTSYAPKITTTKRKTTASTSRPRTQTPSTKRATIPKKKK
jgi:hypothetical protein